MRILAAKKSESGHQDLMQKAVICLIAYISSGFTANYLRIEPIPLLHLVLFLLGVISAKYVRDHREHFSLRTVLCFSAFSLLFSISLVLGYQIITGESLYFGTADQNYIAPYTPFDLIALFLIIIYTFLFTLGTYAGLKHLATKRSKTHELSHEGSRDSVDRGSIKFASIPLTSILMPTLIIFVAYLPYLLVYYPGLEFGGSYHSLAQATGQEPWSNHHPVVYSFFIKCCLAISSLFELGMGGGRALYSITQMAFMAVCFAYMIRWVTTRCNLNGHWTATLTLIFALTPYIASYGMAMWKDPVFQ